MQVIPVGLQLPPAEGHLQRAHPGSGLCCQVIWFLSTAEGGSFLPLSSHTYDGLCASRCLMQDASNKRKRFACLSQRCYYQPRQLARVSARPICTSHSVNCLLLCAHSTITFISMSAGMLLQGVDDEEKIGQNQRLATEETSRMSSCWLTPPKMVPYGFVVYIVRRGNGVTGTEHAECPQFSAGQSELGE